ncbi:pentatricopeptide repeat-containing protein At1g80270, mitochondrial-like [Impatiens glandulifera]|uniref:pentatricopeptide repeat-containing protein At1g80270, mitochondrial-like n=1 Tax=Impatiens glandulifera TaxID=253017 RepID=UPI001FB05F53|nr:pentatricopeptide repeat-containing protein At1g80270, mitochondrial-like [Impatiens glandulifera]
MWAVRRLNHPLRIRTFRAVCAKSELTTFSDDKAATVSHLPQMIRTENTSLKGFHGTNDCFRGRCMFSSQAGGVTDSGDEEDDLDDGFSELESSTGSLVEVSGEVNKDELVSEPDLSDDDDNEAVEEHSNELDLYDENEVRGADKESIEKKSALTLFKSVMNSSSVENAMDKWIEDGNELQKLDINFVMVNLRKRRMYGRALQFSEWLESRKQIDFVERDYASRLDLISKVKGLHKAENYIDRIPVSFRGEVVYRTLLCNTVMNTNVNKSEEVFNKMKDLGFPITSFSCNQLLLLYKRTDKKKIADVLLLMEKQDVKPTLFTYHMLIDTKGQSNDITGMEQIFETMKSEGIEPDTKTLSLIAKHYVFGGLKEKAIATLKQIEGDNIKELRRSAQVLLPLYANLEDAEEVSRIWKACEQNPTSQESLAAIEALGRLNKVEEAEAVFDAMQLKWKNPSLKQYTTLLKVYVEQKKLDKGKDLVKKMAESGLRIGPWTWDVLVKLYVAAGEIEKADSILHKAGKQNQTRPLFHSFLVIMEEYAKKGDIHNTEKMFNRMRQSGYVSRVRQFQTLLQAYTNAKVPAYGIRERMKADNIFPNKGLAAQLAQVDPFRRTPVSDLLD